MMGAVHAYLRAHVPEWAVLRPTWFMQNFSELQHLATIRDESRIYSATGDGRVPFVDAGDIAAVASQALTQEVPLNRDVIITGPEALSYGAVAAILSSQTGRAITHERLTPAALADRFAAAGMPEAYAKMLAAMDDAIASGSEDRTTTEVEQLTGRPPLSFSTFATMAGSVWQRPG